MNFKRLIYLLDSKDEELRTNVIQALLNICELPSGLLIITKHLAKSIPYLEEVNNYFNDFDYINI